GGVGERLLVAGHAGGEDDLAECGADSAVRAALEAAAVLEDEYSGCLRGCGPRARGGQDDSPFSGAALRRSSSGSICCGSADVRRRNESTRMPSATRHTSRTRPFGSTTRLT